MIERDAALGAERAIELLRSEFQRAQNAGYFPRIAGEDFSVRLVARERAVAHAGLAAA